MNKTEAVKTRYGTNTYKKGHSYNPTLCCIEVWDQGGWGSYQCSRKNGYGPDKLFCKQHAKIEERDRK